MVSIKLEIAKRIKILNIVNEKPIFLVLKIFKYDNGFGTEMVCLCSLPVSDIGDYQSPQGTPLYHQFKMSWL